MGFFSSIPKLGLMAALTVSVSLSASAQQGAAPLSAQDSDPRVMGWMQGFPPSEDKIITQPDSVYFSFPRLRWSVCHLREFLPTEQISQGSRCSGTAALSRAQRVRRSAPSD